MRKFMWLTACVLMLAVCASAQEGPKAEVFLGGSYLRSGGANFRGWNASVGGYLSDWFVVVGDFSGHYYPVGNVHLYSYTFGPRIAYNRGGNVVPFAHVLIGGARAGTAGFSSSGFAMNTGGGIDWVARPNLAIRLMEADAVVTRFSGVTSTDARLSFGVVFRFGK